MDNSHYGDAAPRAEDPADEQARALRELLRVVAPTGSVLVTVPYGRAEDHGWFRQYDEAAVSGLLGSVSSVEASVEVYAYSEHGWRLADLASAAAAEYRDIRADRTPAPDRAAAARSVACLRLRRASRS